MEFNPSNTIVKLCLQGMFMETKGQTEEAGELFLQAWKEATNDLEKFMAAWFVAGRQKNVSDKLKWLETALQVALSTDDAAIKSALSTVYFNIAKCNDALSDFDDANKNNELALSLKDKIFDEGPFYHGTKADLHIGDFLTPGNISNYQEEVVMNHIYFTGIINGAGLAAALAKGDGRPRVYAIEPTGSFENDPNLTDKKFPGNLTRSYRTKARLKIIGEVADWATQTPEDLQEWRDKLAKNKGEIIN
jgi:rifampin ADP-ribosylating transferase